MKTIGNRHILGTALSMLALLPLASAAFPSPADATDAAATCQGEQATLVGTPGEVLMGTDGDDVIAGNGAGKILGLAGNDVICVTGETRRIIVRDGRGDDSVDAREFEGGAIVARLGDGSDSYRGSSATDFVSSEIGSAGDQDVIRTYAGDDAAHAFDGRDVREVRIDLGPGDDEAYFDEQVEVRAVGGNGRDFVSASCECDHAVARLAGGVVAFDGTARVVEGFESVSVSGARQTELHGTDGDNFLGTDACVAWADGRSGDDILSHDDNYGRCVQTSRLYGRAGDDELWGYNGVDELYGGRGEDLATAGSGNDLCRAEEKVGCER